MIWSISTSKAFKRCQRQWYYQTCVANAKAKDPLRHKAYLLSKLQSISGWRGNIVDLVISDTIIPAVKAGREITLTQAKRAAEEIFEKQLACAREHCLLEPGFSPSALGSDFTAFYCMEYEGEIPEAQILQAKGEIYQALNNLFSMREICTQVKAAEYLISQRVLSFSHSGITVKSVPDLIAFYKDKPPLILDWKVHAFGVKTAKLQLGTYALALARCNPHRDFPASLVKWKETDIQLLEVQLLTKQIRSYNLTEKFVDVIDNYIAESVNEITLARGKEKVSLLPPSEFPVAKSPDICQCCAYRSMCWETA